MNEEYLKGLHGSIGVDDDYETWVGAVKENDEYLKGLHGSIGVEDDYETWKSAVWGETEKSKKGKDSGDGVTAESKTATQVTDYEPENGSSESKDLPKKEDIGFEAFENAGYFTTEGDIVSSLTEHYDDGVFGFEESDIGNDAMIAYKKDEKGEKIPGSGVPIPLDNLEEAYKTTMDFVNGGLSNSEKETAKLQKDINANEITEEQTSQNILDVEKQYQEMLTLPEEVEAAEADIKAYEDEMNARTPEQVRADMVGAGKRLEDIKRISLNNKVKNLEKLKNRTDQGLVSALETARAQVAEDRGVEVETVSNEDEEVVSITYGIYNEDLNARTFKNNVKESLEESNDWQPARWFTKSDDQNEKHRVASIYRLG